MTKRILIAALLACAAPHARAVLPAQTATVVTPKLLTAPARVTVTAAGGTNVDFAFKTTSSSHLEVFLDGAKISTGYTVTLYTNQDSSPGGYVVFTTPPVSGTKIVVQRTVPLGQPSVWTTWNFNKPLAAALDYVGMQTQQLDRKIGDTDAAWRAAFEDLVDGHVLASSVWSFTGDGTATVFAIAGAAVTTSASYVVTLDGIVQKPTTDYAVNASTDQITFTTAPPDGAAGVVRLLGYVQASSDLMVTATGSTTARSLADRFADEVNVKDFGARCDGATDDTVPIRAADAASRTVVFPSGVCVMDAVALSMSECNANDCVGRHWRGQGIGSTTLKMKAGATGLLAGGVARGFIVVGNPAYGIGGVDFRFNIDNVIEDLSVDVTNLPDDADHAGILLLGTYNNEIRNVQFLPRDVARTSYDYMQSLGAFTTELTNVHGIRMQIARTSGFGTVPTTLSTHSCSWTNVECLISNNVWMYGTTIQGTVEAGYTVQRAKVASCSNVHFSGGDMEGNGVAFDIANSHGVNITGWGEAGFAPTYTSGGVQASTLYALANSSDVMINGNTRANIQIPAAAFSGGILYGDGGGNTKVACQDATCGTGWTYRDNGGFTPTIAGNEGGVATYTTRIGQYQRIGQRVTIAANLAWSGWAVAPAGGTTVVYGLPFPVSESMSQGCSVSHAALPDISGALSGFMPATGTQVNIESFVAGVSASFTPPNSAGALILNCTYLTDAN